MISQKLTYKSHKNNQLQFSHSGKPKNGYPQIVENQSPLVSTFAVKDFLALFQQKDKKRSNMMKKVILILMTFFPLYLFGQNTGVLIGKASYYSDVFQNKKTANGERYYKDSLTAAHLKYPFGTYIKVTNLQNDKSVVVRINDRGPVKKTRILDLSKRAAMELDMMKAGVVNVKVEVVDDPNKNEEEEEKPQNTSIAKAEITSEKEKEFKTIPASSPSNNPGKVDYSTLPYTIQVAALREKANMEKLRANLNQKGFTNNSVSTEQKEELTLYKINLGPFASEADAQQTLSKLKANNFDGIIRKKL